MDRLRNGWFGGSGVHALANEILPVSVFNQFSLIEETHAKMTKIYHSDGGPWKRVYAPSVLCFFRDDQGWYRRKARSS